MFPEQNDFLNRARNFQKDDNGLKLDRFPQPV